MLNKPNEIISGFKSRILNPLQERSFTQTSNYNVELESFVSGITNLELAHIEKLVVEDSNLSTIEKQIQRQESDFQKLLGSAGGLEASICPRLAEIEKLEYEIKMLEKENQLLEQSALMLSQGEKTFK